MGSPLDHSGYACSLAALVRDWRSYWSATPGTTDPLAPFGLFTIHPQGCEGAAQIGLMRHAQTANVGHSPNELLPNVLVAQAFDAGDPWANANSWTGAAGCEEVDQDGKFGPNCLPFDDSRWDSATKYIAALTYNTSIKMYMGGLHPRLKSVLSKVSRSGSGTTTTKNKLTLLAIPPASPSPCQSVLLRVSIISNLVAPARLRGPPSRAAASQPGRGRRR